MPVAAVRAEDHVFVAQAREDASGDRFLADIGVAGAMDKSALVGLGELQFAFPDEQHPAIHFEPKFLFNARERGSRHESSLYKSIANVNAARRLNPLRRGPG
jgi:hypothetical protein